MSRKSKAAEFVQEGYNTTVTGRNVQVTDGMKAYAIEKISKIEKFSHRIIDVVVTMDIQRAEHHVDIVLKLDHILVKSHGASENMYASIDKAVDKISAQLRKYKDRIQDHQAKGVSAIDMNVNVFRAPEVQNLLDVNGDIEEENERRLLETYRPHSIVNQKVVPVKFLTCEEAIMKMELSGDSFLIFRGEEDRKIKVIYRRKDGNFGVMEPEG